MAFLSSERKPLYEYYKTLLGAKKSPRVFCIKKAIRKMCGLPFSYAKTTEYSVILVFLTNPAGADLFISG